MLIRSFCVSCKASSIKSPRTFPTIDASWKRYSPSPKRERSPRAWCPNFSPPSLWHVLAEKTCHLMPSSNLAIPFTPKSLVPLRPSITIDVVLSLFSPVAAIPRTSVRIPNHEIEQRTHYTRIHHLSLPPRHVQTHASSKNCIERPYQVKKGGGSSWLRYQCENDETVSDVRKIFSAV